MFACYIFLGQTGDAGFDCMPLRLLPILRIIKITSSNSFCHQLEGSTLSMPSVVVTTQGVNDWGRYPPWESLYIL